MNKESFVYLWYDSRSKMFYLGKHKGTPDDGYTHSSKRWQQFKSDSVPQGVRRRIIAWGIDEDMYELETKLLLNRKEKCWDRYYNINIGGDFAADYNDPEYKKMMRKSNYDNKKVQNRKSKLAKERWSQKDFRKKMFENNHGNKEVKEKLRQKFLGDKNSNAIGPHKLTFEDGSYIIVPNLARWAMDSNKYDWAQLFHLKKGWKMQGGKKFKILRCKDIIKVEEV